MSGGTGGGPLYGGPISYGPQAGGGTGQHAGFSVSILFGLVNDASLDAQTKLTDIKNRRSAISIGDMFEMQMLMNHLSQLSEAASDVVSASNSALITMARGVKGG